MAHDPFIGTWKLDPSQNRYEAGSPPQNGLYIIEPLGEGYRITMKWTTPEGQSVESAYESIPDGQEYPYDKPAIADAISMTRVDARTLDSQSKKGGQVIAYARRVLSEDGQTMSITQSGTKPDGTRFSNKSVYHRQD